MKRILLLVCLLSFLFSACGNEEDFNAANTPYFKLKAYFIREIKTLFKEKMRYSAASNSDGKFDELFYQYPDWYKQFEFFMRADINKSYLNGKYSVDSIPAKNEDGERRTEVFYRAKEKDASTQLLEVTYDSTHTVTSLKVETYSSNLISSIRSKLIYIPGEKIYTHSEEDNRIFGTSVYGTNGKIIH